MGRTSKLSITESVEYLKKAISKQRKYQNSNLLKALLYIKQERFKTREELSQYIGVTIRTIENWVRSYKSEGLELLLIPEKLVRHSHLIPSDVKKAIKERVYDETLGFKSYVEAQRWLATEFNLDLKYNMVREYLIRHFKTKIKSPRKSHIKKDDQAVEAFLKTT